MATVMRRPGSPAVTESKLQAPKTARLLQLVGFWSAVLATIFYVGWLTGAMVGFVVPRPWSEYATMAPSIFIPLAWVPLMVAIRSWASEERRIFAEIAMAFAVMYGALLTMNYFVALTVTIPKEASGADVGILAIQPQGFFLAVEAVGYTLLSLSALFAAFVFRAPGLQRWIRWMLLGVGVLGLALPLQMFWSTWPSPPVIALIPREFAVVAALVLLAVMFWRGERPLSSDISAFTEGGSMTP